MHPKIEESDSPQKELSGDPHFAKDQTDNAVALHITLAQPT